MKQIKLLSLFIASISFLPGCPGGNASAGNKDTAPANENAATTSSDENTATAVNASFSVSIDGTPVSGNETNDLQIQNEAFIYPPKNNGPQTVLFDLLSNKKGDDFYG